MSKLICMGESLIDMLPVEVGGEKGYVMKAGGAPSNVCAGAAKLGADAYFLASLSTDNFGKFLTRELLANGVKADMLRYCANQTGLAIVSHNEKGDREFSFYHNNTADMCLSPTEVSENDFEKGDILHFCSPALVESPTKHAHKKAVDLAVRKGVTVSFDINVRLPFWEKEEDCRAAVLEFLPYADIVKLTDEEIVFITGIKQESAAVAEIFKVASRAKIVFLTKGPKGAAVYDRSGASFERAAVDAPVVDTTGAGDCFIGSVLYCLLNGKADLTLSGMRGAVDFASCACAVIVGRKGAGSSMPTYTEVKKVMQAEGIDC